MPSDQELESFIRSSFRSVWAIELMLHLKRGPRRDWTTGELVQALRASDLVVASGLQSLVAAGLALMQEDGRARYAPASPDIERLAEGTERLYAKKPDAVRRLIVAAATDGLAAFADAFRLRRD
jgi:hypothetical protein